MSSASHPPSHPHAPTPSGSPDRPSLGTPLVGSAPGSAPGSGKPSGGTPHEPFVDDPQFEQMTRTLANKSPVATGSVVKAPFPELARYQIVEEIGRGGMGVVWRVRDSVLGRDVALKLVRSGPFASPRELERFQKEAQAIARLNHPRIVKVFDFGTINGQCFFTMDLAEGGSLSRQRAKFSEPEAAVNLLIQIARAVHYIHERGLLHRDLKPANILLDASGQPLVSDFGLARTLDTEVDSTVSEAVGTPAYMAPEQITRNCPLNPYSDVWSLGVILYELLCSRRPFAKTERPDHILAILRDDPKSPRYWRKDLDPSLDAIVLKCLEKNPAARYSSAAELADDLERWQRGEPVHARPWPWRRRIGRAIRRHPVLAFGCGLLLFVPVIAAALAWILDPERHVRDVLEPTLRAGRPAILVDGDEPPRWYRWRRPGVIEPRATENPTFRIHSGSLGLMELLPRVPIEAFRFRADVRLVSGREGDAGLYLAYGYDPSGIHSFLNLGFAETRFPKIQDGFAIAGLSHYSDLSHFGRRRHQLGSTRLAEQGQRAWRKLVIERTADRLSFGIDGIPVADVSDAQLAKVSPIHPRPDQPGLVYSFPPNNGLGLFIDMSEAAFRDVVVEPLFPLGE